MNEATSNTVARVGVDLSKQTYQVHAVDRHGKVLLAKSMSVDRFFAWCASLQPGCLVAMEACGGAHHVARRLLRQGLDARLIAPSFVMPYRMAGRGGKNDANDAAAICEAASRPQMRFVPPKSREQQGHLCVHRLREGYKSDRTSCINRIRGLLMEFGLVFPKTPEALLRVLSDVLEDASNELTDVARLALQQAQEHWRFLEERLHWCDQRIAAHVRDDAQAKRAMQVMGIGPITASAFVLTVSNPSTFRNGAQLGAWLGLVPSQHSTGGKAKLGRITKHGDTYLRSLMIQGAKSAVMTAHLRTDRISQWALALKARLGWQGAVVALANKNARLLWAMLTRGSDFDPNHVPPIPAARCPKAA